MKEYKKIQPEVIVGLGNDTEFLEQKPPFKTIINLHIDLEDWLGDDLMECNSCYIVTEQLKNDLENTTYKGFEFVDLELTLGEYFKENYRQKKDLPNFYWLKVIGRKDIDDLYIGDESMLYVSDDFLKFLTNKFVVNYLEIEPERDEFDDLLDRMIAESKR